jgi:hypothetical protein
MRERERERKKRIGGSTTSKPNVVYGAYNTAVGIVVHGKQRRETAKQLRK